MKTSADNVVKYELVRATAAAAVAAQIDKTSTNNVVKHELLRATCLVMHKHIV